MSTNQYDLMNAEYKTIDGKAVIHLSGRDKDRTLKWFFIHNYPPHFYGADPDGPLLDLFNRPIKEIVVFHPSDVPNERKKYPYHDEANIKFPWRYLIDKKITCGFTSDGKHLVPSPDLGILPHIGLFDLEVETPSEIMARPESPSWPIVSFQFHDNYTNGITIFMLSTAITGEAIPHPNYIAPDISIKLPITFHLKQKGMVKDIIVYPSVYLYSDEISLLKDVNTWVMHQQFDDMGGYNSGLFDFPYWIRRCQALRIDVSVISPFRRVQCSPRKDQEGKVRMDPYVKGVQLIDLYDMYKKWTGGRQPIVKGRPFGTTYDFHLVMEYECGFYYVDLGDKVKESRSAHPYDWLEYCCGDAFALGLLERQKGIIAHFERFRRNVGLPLTDAIHNSRLGEMRLLRLRDRPLPSRQQRVKSRVKGAVVLLPTKGIHEYVVVVDIKTLYPALITIYNLSPETLSASGLIKVGPMEDGTILRFKRSPIGILPKAVAFDMALRETYRNQLKSLGEKSAKYEGVKLLETLHKFMSCLRKGTQILTPRGRRSIESIKIGDAVYGLSDDHIVRTKVLATSCRNTSILCKVTTTDPKRTLFITPDHPVKVTRRVRRWEWREVKTLRPKTKGTNGFVKDYLYRVTALPVTETSSLPDDEIVMLASWIAEGTQEVYGTGSPTISNKDLEIVSVWRNAVKHFGCQLKETSLKLNYRISSNDRTENKFTTMLRKYDLFCTNSYEKFIPSIIFHLPRDKRKLFFDWLIKCDGSDSWSSWRYFTVSKQLADDVSRLALTLDLPNSIYHDQKRNRYILYGCKRTDPEAGVKAIETFETNEEVFNLQTKCESYIANDIIVHNCSYYGLTGYEGFILYSDDVRKAITFLGREALQECRRELEKEGYHIEYGDTDGLFVKLSGSQYREGFVVEETVNTVLRRISIRHGSRFTLESKFEHFCKRIIFVPKIQKSKGMIIAAKKRYAYIDEHNTLNVTGLAPRRSSTPSIARDNMMEWLKLILIKNDVEGAKKLVKSLWNTLPTLPLNTIGLPRGIHKDKFGARNPWIDGRDYMHLHYGKLFREDKKPLLIYMDRKKMIHAGFMDNSPKNTQQIIQRTSNRFATDVICITERDTELPTELAPFINWEKMKIKVIRANFKQLFDAIGIYWNEVLSDSVQKGLDGRHVEIADREIKEKVPRYMKPRKKIRSNRVKVESNLNQKEIPFWGIQQK